MKIHIRKTQSSIPRRRFASDALFLLNFESMILSDYQSCLLWLVVWEFWSIFRSRRALIDLRSLTLRLSAVAMSVLLKLVRKETVSNRSASTSRSVTGLENHFLKRNRRTVQKSREWSLNTEVLFSRKGLEENICRFQTNFATGWIFGNLRPASMIQVPRTWVWNQKPEPNTHAISLAPNHDLQRFIRAVEKEKEKDGHETYGASRLSIPNQTICDCFPSFEQNTFFTLVQVIGQICNCGTRHAYNKIPAV